MIQNNKTVKRALTGAVHWANPNAVLPPPHCNERSPETHRHWRWGLGQWRYGDQSRYFQSVPLVRRQHSRTTCGSRVRTRSCVKYHCARFIRNVCESPFFFFFLPCESDLLFAWVIPCCCCNDPISMLRLAVIRLHTYRLDFKKTTRKRQDKEKSRKQMHIEEEAVG